MTTKDLSRSVIEGGRAPRNRWERRSSNSVQRRREAALAATLLTTADLDAVVFPVRPVVGRWFSDKLGPAKRWLARQVGRPWNAVHSELLERFDPRTTAGRHVVYDHLLPCVDRDGSGRSAAFSVDRHGILRRAPRRGSHVAGPPRLPGPTEPLAEWLGGRRVGARGAHYYWFIPTAAGLFRQERRLEPDEAERWRALPLWLRRQHAVFEGP